MLILIIIAISLSTDAFSLALAYGTLNLDKSSKIILSIVVGIYHFIMTLLGYLLDYFFIENIPIKSNIVVFLIFFVVGIQMIFGKQKEIQNRKISIIEMLLFGLAVSLDSFSVGISLNDIYNNLFMASIIFAICSFSFTYIGLNIGQKINKKLGKISTIIGGIILIIISIIYLFK